MVIKVIRWHTDIGIESKEENVVLCCTFGLGCGKNNAVGNNHVIKHIRRCWNVGTHILITIGGRHARIIWMTIWGIAAVQRDIRLINKILQSLTRRNCGLRCIQTAEVSLQRGRRLGCPARHAAGCLVCLSEWCALAVTICCSTAGCLTEMVYYAGILNGSTFVTIRWGFQKFVTRIETILHIMLNFLVCRVYFHGGEANVNSVGRWNKMKKERNLNTFSAVTIGRQRRHSKTRHTDAFDDVVSNVRRYANGTQIVQKVCVAWCIKLAYIILIK